MPRRAVSAAVVAALALSSAALHAQANDEAAAQALFEEGKRLMTAGEFEAACPVFAESQRLDPGIGTMLWLAECHAKSGRLASAWALFHEAEALAIKSEDPRAAVARDEAAKLEPLLSYLVVDVPAAARLPGLTITRDDVALGEPLWGGSIPTDSGVHRVRATAPDRVSWEEEVVVPPDGGSATITIPVLAAASMAPDPEPSTADPSRGRAQRILGLGLFGVGLASAGVGTYFGLVAHERNDASRGHCDDANTCDAIGYDARRASLRAATMSNIGFAAAGGALLGGAILYFTAPKPVQAAVRAQPLYGGAAAVLEGSFP